MSPDKSAWTARRYAVKVQDGRLELLRLEPDTKPGLAWMQEQVQGHIELVQREGSNNRGYEIDVWGNEEAKLIGMPLNVFRRDGERLHGPLVVLAGDPEGDSVPLTLAEASRVSLVQLVDFEAPILRVLRAEQGEPKP